MIVEINIDKIKGKKYLIRLHLLGILFKNK
jgi:hypothetical protein